MSKSYLREKLLPLSFFLVFIGLVFFENIKSPETLISAGGDGMKNYFTYLYHIKYDSTFWVFEGMNYPFGENIVFTDNQPLLSNIVKWIYNITPMSNETLISIHNLTLFFSLAFGALGIFLCLRYLQTGYYFALFCTAGLILLQPQISRFNAHYSMVYPVLPWIFYLWLHFWNKQSQFRVSVGMGLLISIFGMLHMYHFLTCAVLCGLAISIYTLMDFRWKTIKNSIIFVGIQIILPFLLLSLMANFIHPVSDRPEKVWGFFSYHSYWEGLFFSYDLPLFHFINENIISVRKIDPIEAVNYIGLPSIIFIFGFVLLKIYRKKTWYDLFIKSRNPALLLSFIFLFSALISFGYPFTIKGMEGLLDYSGPFQQFRSIGRLGWISFYAINFLSIPYIYKILDPVKVIPIRYLLLSTVPLLLVYEGITSLPVLKSPEHLENAYKTHANKYDFDQNKYQTIIPDPYLHVGSECFARADKGGNQDQNFSFGIQYGMPSMGVVLSRNSLNQAAMLNELMCQPYQVPKIIDILKKKDTRPLLVFESKLDLYDDTKYLTHWTKNTKIVYEGQGFRLRELPLHHFDTIVAAFRDSLINNPMDTIVNLPLIFDHSKKDRTWGHEVVIKIDEKLRGDNLFIIQVAYKENTDVNAIFECWQYADSPDHIDQFSLRINNNIKKMEDGKLYIEVPVPIKPETKKMSIRMYKDRQKKNEFLPFENPRLIKVVSKNK